MDQAQPSDPMGDFIQEKLAEQNRRDLYSLAGTGARLGESRGGGVAQWSAQIDVGIANAAAQLPDMPADVLAQRKLDVEQQVQMDLLGQEARAGSVQGAQMFLTGGAMRAPVRGGIGNFEMVRNGNWDAALNIGADPYGILGELPGLQQDLATLGRVQAEDRINTMRQRLIDAGVKNVPSDYRTAWDGNGNLIRDYAATAGDLQTRYEWFVRDQRLQQTWGENYQDLRIGKSQMTVLEFEKRILDVQQDATDRAYAEGVSRIASGDLKVKNDYATTLGNYIDDQVRGQLRRLAAAEGISDNAASTLWAVNRNISSDIGRGIPDNRLGLNLFADTTLALKNGYTEQLMKWNAIRPDANYIMIRPTTMPGGGAYVIPRWMIQPYTPVPRVGRGL